ncbi:acyltransferase family protein [Aerobium aerolatum]|uniref:Acyltransferase 3 domain-containing protein n=1 Tax=Aquamicrobium aerolatum DSM 21857 TaxID=1121003 RepID=A0A1I3LNR4_9HYPH|nr:acyltransferase family protein [Aquamicrobium aerolatum]SFI86343.1 hypothetical protein SAMN03080618_01560 [Aquamicrobium aerolatum DSM 21857]
MERSDYLDNAKAILITIVVFGHLIESALSNPTTLALYKTIYAFHMPAFVLLAGYLSRSSTFGLKWASELLSIALVLVVAQGLYATRDAMSGNFLGLDYYLHHPRWVLWYLASLLAWKASLPLLRYGYVSVLLAVAISIVAGWVHYDPMLYSWQRTATFLRRWICYSRKKNICAQHKSTPLHGNRNFCVSVCLLHEPRQSR